MTQEEIIELAMKAGDHGRLRYNCEVEWLEAFARLVAERAIEEYVKTTEGRS